MFSAVSVQIYSASVVFQINRVVFLVFSEPLPYLSFTLQVCSSQKRQQALRLPQAEKLLASSSPLNPLLKQWKFLSQRQYLEYASSSSSSSSTTTSPSTSSPSPSSYGSSSSPVVSSTSSVDSCQSLYRISLWPLMNELRRSLWLSKKGSRSYSSSLL